jgi:hypothetical protein
MVTLLAPLSREVEGGFLTCSGNSFRKIRRRPRPDSRRVRPGGRGLHSRAGDRRIRQPCPLPGADHRERAGCAALRPLCGPDRSSGVREARAKSTRDRTGNTEAPKVDEGEVSTGRTSGYAPPEEERGTSWLSVILGWLAVLGAGLILSGKVSGIVGASSARPGKRAEERSFRALYGFQIRG